ncbi:MAG: P-II family nitrogen regulator [Bacteroidales bacterium OttesenSCG-928-I14]|jgi:nitrogen regulatory protein PII 2|nr:P-II family nitrogen regulator [Bacteroidales bacterium OttesenSCG-928-I14]
MKLILAIIRVDKMGETKQALGDVGLPSFTVMPVLGRGSGCGSLKKNEKITSDFGEDILYKVPRLKSKRMITLVVTDVKKKLAIETIIKVNHTAKSGDGKIFVINTLDSFTIQTGVSGDVSLD